MYGTVDNFIELEEKTDLGADWSAFGFWCRPGAFVLVRLTGPKDGPPRFVDARLDVVAAAFVDDVPCSPTGPAVEKLVLEISCELSSSTLSISD
jgi:hypothetical protein